MLFWGLALLILFLAGSLLMAQRVVRAVLALLGAVVGMAFLYFLLGAEAAGAAQLMVYAGGVVVLLLFGVMTATEGDNRRGPTSRPVEIVSGTVLALLLAAGLARVFLPLLQGIQGNLTQTEYTGGSLAGAGQELITRQAAPFEWAAILLLVALAFAAPFAARAGRSQD